jgi:hypothetical protein
MQLTTPLYLTSNAQRQDEIDFCIKQNELNPLITRINLINNRNYAAAFGLAEDGINILANSDIYFDETLSLAQDIKEGEVYCLSRWDKTDSGIKHLNAWDTQDAWIFRGKMNVDANFDLGTPGCDNRIAYVLQKAGYKVLNPSCSIRAIHVHQSNHRTYTDAQRLPPPYLLLNPHKINETCTPHSVI